MLFDSTLRRDLARSFGATLVIIVTIVVTIMLIRTLGQAAVGRVSPQDVVFLLGYVALGHLPTMMALSLFVAIVSTLSRMYRDSEMAIWFSSGVSLTRFLRPVLQLSWPVLIVVALLALFVWPWQNRRSAELKDRFERRSDLSRVAPGQFQTSSDGSRVFFIEREADDSAAARNVFILGSVPPVESVTAAHTGHVEMQGADRVLILNRGQRNDENMKSGEKTLARFVTYQVQVGDKVISELSDLPPRARRSIELWHGATPAFRGELVWRAGLFLTACNLVLLGIGLSASNPRRAANWNLLLALLGFVVYFNAINLSKAWVAGGKVGAATVLVAVHGGALLIGLGLLWSREQQNRRRPRARRAPGRRGGPNAE